MVNKVIVQGTGFVGKMVIEELLDHPEFEIVGAIVHDPLKDGQDIGAMVGRAPIGILASTDAEAVLALEADAVAHFGPTAQYAAVNIEDMSRALRAGKNVVSTAMTPLVYPKACPAAMTDPLEAACREGGTSCFTTGIDPGFANDLLPLTLIGLCGHVDSVRVQEILDYASYTGDYAPMGIGEPMETEALLENPKVLTFAWGHTIPMMADALGVTLDKIDTTWEKWAAPEPIDFQNGRIERGHCAAVRFQIRGWVDREPKIVVEHVNRITHAAAPEWPRGKIEENDCYRVDIRGNPDIVQETAFRGGANGDPNAGGCLATGMRAVQAIPAVCAAPPGLLSALDLPVIPGKGTLR
ncbi:MAG: dihydrodipicolinate reductase [Deltaproteobacteria bacterium]|nr:dihydrodipicolinate reductase [Deltaproteobacteria bacterium]